MVFLPFAKFLGLTSLVSNGLTAHVLFYFCDLSRHSPLVTPVVFFVCFPVLLNVCFCFKLKPLGSGNTECFTHSFSGVCLPELSTHSFSSVVFLHPNILSFFILLFSCGFVLLCDVLRTPLLRCWPETLDMKSVSVACLTNTAFLHCLEFSFFLSFFPRMLSSVFHAESCLTDTLC